MTITEKKYVGVFVAFMSMASKNPKCCDYFVEVCRALNISQNDVVQCMKSGTSKDEMFRVIRSMNNEDKKLAQQYFANACFADGSETSAMIFSEVLEECNMFDGII